MRCFGGIYVVYKLCYLLIHNGIRHNNSFRVVVEIGSICVPFYLPLCCVLVFLLCLLVASLASIILTNGFTMLVGIIFALFSFIAPQLASLKYVFPNGYVNVLGHMSFNSSILLIMLLL